MPLRFLKIFLLYCLTGILILSVFNSLAFAQTPAEDRQALEQQLQQLEDQIAQYQQDLTKTQQQKNTLQNQINALKKKIQTLDLQIKENNLIVQQVTSQMQDTQSSIETTSKKIEDTSANLNSILQLVNEEDQKNVVEILFSGKTISDFFDNLVALNNLNSKTQILLSDIKQLKTTLEDQKTSLENEKGSKERLLQIQTLQKQDLATTKTSQEQLLVDTKGKETNYQQLLAETQKKAQEIKSRIFQLIGVPQAPTFGEAYTIAKYVSGITGIRPAFLLAVMTQESNIGKNVGQCYLTNTKTGEGVRTGTNKKESRTMNPTRDVPYFINIVQQLGRDLYNTPISCPLSVGWGGAMGPAQFIPSTWVKSGYGSKVENITGKNADPWDINDAFLAAGLYLKDAGGVKDEFTAAMRYFSGTTWTKSEQFYGRSVLAIASGYEDDIKTIESNSTGFNPQIFSQIFATLQ